MDHIILSIIFIALLPGFGPIWLMAVCFNLCTGERPILPEDYWRGVYYLEYTERGG